MVALRKLNLGPSRDLFFVAFLLATAADHAQLRPRSLKKYRHDQPKINAGMAGPPFKFHSERSEQNRERSEREASKGSAFGRLKIHERLTLHQLAAQDPDRGMQAACWLLTV